VRRAVSRKFKEAQREQIESALHVLECIGEHAGWVMDRYRNPETGKVILVINDPEWAAKVSNWLVENGVFAKDEHKPS
jgi:hypothetical protein